MQFSRTEFSQTNEHCPTLFSQEKRLSIHLIDRHPHKNSTEIRKHEQIVLYFKVIPKNVGIEMHLKDREMSQIFSNYTALKVSEQAAAGRSCEITLSSSVK